MERCSARGRSLRIRTPVHTDRFLNVLDFLRGEFASGKELLCLGWQPVVSKIV